MKTVLYIVLQLTTLISAIPVAQNISDVELVLDQELNDEINCEIVKHSDLEKPKTILSDLKGLLQSILTDTLLTDEEKPNVKCRNTTLEGLHGVVFHDGGNRPELLQHGGIIDVRSEPRIPSCDGSLTLIVENRILGDSEIRLVTKLKLTGWRYGNLLRSLMREKNTIRNVIKVQTEGNCCWKIFSKPRYRGLTQFINPGFDEAPRNRIKSAKKIDCHEYKED